MEGALVCKAFHQTVTDFVSRKCDGACLVSSAILLKRVGYGELIQGYLINDVMKYYVRHYWCRIDGKDYDGFPVEFYLLVPILDQYNNFSILGVGRVGVVIYRNL